VAKEITVADIEREQAEMQELAQRLLPADLDQGERETLVQELAERAARLQGKALRFQAEQLGLAEGEAPATPRAPWILVQLTPEQQERIARDLGVRVEAVKLADPEAGLSEVMPQMPPSFVEAMAYRHARIVQRLKEWHARALQEASPEARELVQLVMKDEAITRPIHDNLVLAPGELPF